MSCVADCAAAAGQKALREMSGRQLLKRSQKFSYTFKDFFAEQKAKKKRRRGDTTPSLPAPASALLSAVAQVKRRAPAPALREQARTPSTQRPQAQTSVETGLSDGATAALSSAAIAPETQAGARAAKLLRPDTQRLVADKRARKRKNDFLRQATSGLGAARTNTASSDQYRTGHAQKVKANNSGLQFSTSGHETSHTQALASQQKVSDNATSARGQNPHPQTAQTTKDPECSATKPPMTKHHAITGDAATQLPAVQPVGENHRFYLNARKSAPSGEFIDQIHAEWSNQYAKLEKHHSYIQWLFPVYENAGVNRKAHPLSKREATAMRNSPIIARRIVTSYRMMLQFYGFMLVDETTGEVRKSEAWQPRFRNFNDHTHNNLRISRILVSLGELGFKRYKAPLLEALRIEIFENNQLRACRNSFVSFWKGLVTDEDKPWYVRKTREASDADRGESVFFAVSSHRPSREAIVDANHAAFSEQRCGKRCSPSGSVVD